MAAASAAFDVASREDLFPTARYLTAVGLVYIFIMMPVIAFRPVLEVRESYQPKEKEDNSA